MKRNPVTAFCLKIYQGYVSHRNKLRRQDDEKLLERARKTYEFGERASLGDYFLKEVNRLAEVTGRSKAEVLRDALNLFSHAVQQYEEEGKGVTFAPIHQEPPQS